MPGTRELRCCALYQICNNTSNSNNLQQHLAITKHVDLILGDFNEDSLLNERPITTSSQSLGFTQIVSEPTHVQGDHIYIRNNQNSLPNFDVLLNSVYFSHHDSIVLYY